MDLSDPPRKPRAESIVPMINVVFLLLIFFLMTSNLAKPEPFEIAPPEASSNIEPEVERMLYVDKDGLTSFEGSQGDKALSALAEISSTDNIIQVRADGALEATVMAGLLRELTALGLTRVELVVAPK